MFPNPVSVAISNYCTILFLCKNESKRALFRAELPCQVGKVEEGRNFSFRGTYVSFIQGIALIICKGTLISIVDTC